MDKTEESIWRSLADINPFGIVITSNTNLLYINPAASHIFRTLNLNSDDITEELLSLQSIHEAEPYILEINDRTLAVTQFDGIMPDKNAKVFYIADRTELLHDKYELYIYKTYLDSITDQGIMVIDANERIILFNTPSATYDALPKDVVLGRKFRDIYPSIKNSAILETLKTGKIILDIPMKYTTKEGKNNASFGSAYPIKKNGKTIAAIAVQRWSDSAMRLISKTMEFKNHFAKQHHKRPNNTSFSFEDIIGDSPSIKSTIDKAKKASVTPLPVLIYGETGTGKELFAQAIHNASSYNNGPFTAVNCAAIPDTLLESILFGSTKGAFTGAENTTGLFEQAKGGTIFLDELNSMPINLQAKILRVLQEKSFRKLGAKAETPINCRLITSMNKHPLQCIKEKTLREDLYYRISVVAIRIPPLREREGDATLLADYFIKRYTSQYGTPLIEMLPDFLEFLKKYAWPGNVRELQHTIESSLVMLDTGKDLSTFYLPHHLSELCAGEYLGPPSPADHNVSLKEELERTEKNIIIRALKKHNWNITRSANAIGISRSNLQYRMKRLDIAKPK
jgi:arginine utilization regulatory protein